MIEKLIQHVNKSLSPKYKLVVEDIPDEFINVSQNTTNSDKCVSLYKGKELYTDWYYNEFQEMKLREDGRRMMVVDRDMDAVLAGEFRDIGQRIILALDKIKNLEV